MGLKELLERVFRKKDDKDGKETPKPKEENYGQISEEDAAKIYGHPNAEHAWCPKVKVEPIDIRGSQKDGRQPINRSDLGR